MIILLTGASGFTGRHFTRAAQAAGHVVRPLKSNLKDAAALQAEVDGLDIEAVVHLGGIAHAAHADERALYDVNLFGTLNLLAALKPRAARLRKVLVASSANVYGNSTVSPISETQVPAPVNHYAMSKLAMEHMVRALAPELPLLLVRPFNYTGPGQAPSFVIPKLVNAFRSRAACITLGNTHVKREYNDVRMVCEAYLRLLEHGQPGATFNVCTGHMHDLQTVLATLASMTGHELHVSVDPALVRPNEVHQLCGDPARLRQAVGELPMYALEDTLASMLSEPLA